MASKITLPITTQSFELVKNQIGAILSVELPEQSTLNSEPGLNAKIFTERFVPVSDEETPVVTISFGEGDFGLMTSLSQSGEYTFVIDVYEKSKSTVNTRADENATRKLHRLMGVIAAILRNQVYKTLGFKAPFIQHTEVKSLKIAQPTNAKDASSMIMGRVEFLVSVPETNNIEEPTIIAGYVTQALLGETDLGYTYGGDASHLPVEPLCPKIPFSLNDTLIVNAESGSNINVKVKNTNDNEIGSLINDEWIIENSNVTNSNNTFNAEVPAEESKILEDTTYNFKYGGTTTTITLPALEDVELNIIRN